ncbi:MAG: hypothetical protein KC502_01840 [Myxococcales bacterium]|nr:hypothetical protein [Myxococcales bacterium]
MMGGSRTFGGRNPLLAWGVCLTLAFMAIGCAVQEAPLTYAHPSAGWQATAPVDGGPSDGNVQVTDDGAPPALAVVSPHNGAVVDNELVVLTGTASDPIGMKLVRVRVDQGPWLKAQLAAQSGDDTQPKDQWQAWLTVPPGDHNVTIEASDLAGNTASATVKLHRVRRVELVARIPAKAAAPVTLELDKAAVKALIPESAAKEVVIYLLDVRPLLTVALEAFKAPTVWGLDTKTWGTAEWNMHKVLTMTPDTADLKGTSAAPLMTVAANLGLAAPLLLADIAKISATTAFLSTEAVAQGLFTSVIASHPALVTDPTDGVKKVPVTLHDALVDLVTLDAKLGPSGSHPGILYKSSPAPVLLPDFHMTLTGKSNLRQLEGVDLSGGQRWLFIKAPGDDVVVFNFLDPKTFSVGGIADEPQIDLYFTVNEHNGFINSAYSQKSGPDGVFFKGASAGWKLPDWTFERMVIGAVYEAYKGLHSDAGYKTSKTYDIGTINKAATWTWDKGWLSIKTIAGIGAPPPPTYWWDLVLELAQKRLHDGGIAEGKANLKLPLTGIPVPITSAQLIEKARKLFEQQKSKLSAASVGDHSTYDSGCDIFAVRNAAGAVALMYVTAEDLPGGKVTHPTRGLFSDAQLTQKASTTDDSGFGDVSHEKVVLQDGESRKLYAKERTGEVWQLDVKRNGTRVKIALRPVQGAQ